MTKNGAIVSQFEAEFAAYVGAKFAIACTNGTTTLEIALRALGIKAGDNVATTPLTMSATTMAILNVGAVPKYCDADPHTWLMRPQGGDAWAMYEVPVSLYGLHVHYDGWHHAIDDAAQTLRPHSGAAFTSYSFQRSKILNTGEGGMLVTDSEELATIARSYCSLGYDMDPRASRIDAATLKSPDHVRHVRLASNARMNDCTAALGLQQLANAYTLMQTRQDCAGMYHDVIQGFDWLQPQHVPVDAAHDMWCYTVALAHDIDWHTLADSIVANGGEKPYACWRLSYAEPALAHLAPAGTCPVAEDLQPRLMQFQTNDLKSAEKNAAALYNAITDLGGQR